MGFFGIEVIDRYGCWGLKQGFLREQFVFLIVEGVKILNCEDREENFLGNDQIKFIYLG